MSERTNLLTRFVKQLRGERPGTDAGTIGLEDAIHLANLVGSHAQARAGTGANGVGRGDKGIGTEIHVKHRTLRTFAEDGLAFVQQAVHLMLAVHQVELLQVFNAFQPGLFHSLQVIRAIVQALQYLDVTGFSSLILGLKIVQNVTHAQAVTAHLVGIRRADALARGAHLGITLGHLIGRIQQAVRRQDEVRLLRDVQAFLQRMSGCFQRLGLSLEEGGIQHHAVTYYINLVALEYARGDGAKHILLSGKLKRMSGIGTALEAGHHVISGGQHIDNLAFAFVAPLQS